MFNNTGQKWNDLELKHLLHAKDRFLHRQSIPLRMAGGEKKKAANHFPIFALEKWFFPTPLHPPSQIWEGCKL